MQWDPAQYSRYTSERGRPFYDLVTQVGAAAPGRVVDLGCGPGNLTLTLEERWPNADILGIDSSPEMIEQATARADGQPNTQVRFQHGTAELFSASAVDVLISNALLQWVPNHPSLLERWAAELNPSGWLAFQVPANFDSASHQLMRELAESDAWNSRLADVLRHSDAVSSPADYLDLMITAGLQPSVWQTTYLHVLAGDDPVLEWVRGTGLRPVLDALADDEAAQFEAEYGAMLRQAYPQRPYGTVFAFRRTFVVAHKPG